MKKFLLCHSKLLVIPCLFLSSIKGNAQNQYLSTSDLLQPQININSFGNLTISSSGLNPVSNSNQGGSPFFIAEWVKGIVLFKNGKRYDSDNLQFDWVKNELHFKDDNKINRFVEPIQEFLLFDTAANSSDVVYFRSGYPDLRTQTANSFYQVISSGSNYQLLKYWSRHEREVYTYGGPHTSVYTKVEDWYIYDIKNKILSPITLKANSIEEALSYNSKALKQFSSIKKGKRLEPNEVVSLINALNTL